MAYKKAQTKLVLRQVTLQGHRRKPKKTNTGIRYLIRTAKKNPCGPGIVGSSVSEGRGVE